MFNLKKKIILITGAGGFLGTNFCKYLIATGAAVVALDNNKKNLENLQKFIKNLDLSTEKLFLVKCNILNENEIKNVKAKIIKRFKKIDVLINNATYRTKDFKNFYQPFENFDLKIWKKISKVSNEGTFLVTKHIVKHMIKRKSGSIIQIGSIYSYLAPNFEIYKNSIFKGKKMNSPAVYSVNKFGINGLTKYLASYLGKYNIRVNCLSPGGIEQGHSEIFKRNYSSNVPLERMAKIDDLMGLVILLSSSESEFITGQNILIDGGLSCW